MKKSAEMKICRDWDETLIAEYHDNVLKEPARKKFEEHLLKCPACRAAYRGLLNDAGIMGKPVRLPEKIRSFFRVLSGADTIAVGLTDDGLKIPSAPVSGLFFPEFAPAVRGRTGTPVRGIIIPFSSASGFGRIRVRHAAADRAVVECLLDRGGSVPLKVSLMKNGKVLEEKIVSRGGQFSGEFVPVEKGSYWVRLNEEKIISLRIF